METRLLSLTCVERFVYWDIKGSWLIIGRIWWSRWIGASFLIGWYVGVLVCPITEVTVVMQNFLAEIVVLFDFRLSSLCSKICKTRLSLLGYTCWLRCPITVIETSSYGDEACPLLVTTVPLQNSTTDIRVHSDFSWWFRVLRYERFYADKWTDLVIKIHWWSCDSFVCSCFGLYQQTVHNVQRLCRSIRIGGRPASPSGTAYFPWYITHQQATLSTPIAPDSSLCIQWSKAK